MADYNAPDTNNLLPGEPWTTALANAAFENLYAVLEASTTAPRIQSPALGLTYGRNGAITGVADNNVLTSIDSVLTRRFVLSVIADFSLNTTAVAGTSDISLQRSLDNVSWTTMKNLASSSGARVDVQKTFLEQVPVSNTARYFRIIADGDAIHQVSGEVSLILLGDAS